MPVFIYDRVLFFLCNNKSFFGRFYALFCYIQSLRIRTSRVMIALSLLHEKVFDFSILPISCFSSFSFSECTFANEVIITPSFFFCCSYIVSFFENMSSQIAQKTVLQFVQNDEYFIVFCFVSKI